DAAAKAAEAAWKTLPGNPPNWTTEQLSADYLRDLLDVERYRLGQSSFVPLHDPTRRAPTRLSEVQGYASGAIPTLADCIAATVDRLRAAFVETEPPAA